jgi:hypothetical protein
MRASEFITENASAASTTSGSIAPVAMPWGRAQSQEMQDRSFLVNTPTAPRLIHRRG